MIYLSHELALLQAEAQGYDTTIAQLTASAAQQDQAAAAARARAALTRADIVRLNGEAATFQAQAAAADVQAANLDQQIAQHFQNEPERFFEAPPGKPPRPNPEWSTWKAALDVLTQQRDQARAMAAAARVSASQKIAAAAPLQAAAVAADNEAAMASAKAVQLRQQAAGVSPLKDVVTQKIAIIIRWQQELEREPLDRNALETAWRELTARVEVLESQHAGAVEASIVAEKRQWYLQTLSQELSTKISSLNTQIPLAATEVASATTALADLQRRIQQVMGRLPE